MKPFSDAARMSDFIEVPGNLFQDHADYNPSIRNPYVWRQRRLFQVLANLQKVSVRFKKTLHIDQETFPTFMKEVSPYLIKQGL